MEAYGEAKAEFFTRILPESGNLVGAVINLDDPWGARIAGRLTYGVLTYGIDEPADVRAEKLRFGIDGVQFEAVGPWGRLDVTSQLVGRHNVYNLLATLTAIHMLGEDVAEAAAGLARLGVVPGRLEAVENPFGVGIWVDYCHTPYALEKVLTALREVVPGRLITVFGAGGDRDRKKRPQMGSVVEELADVAVVTSDNPRTEDPLAIIDDILGGMSAEFRFTRTLVVPDRATAIRAALGIANEGDGILIGGKGHETYQIIGGTVHQFDDRETAREAVAALEEMQG
jgi:UDP-N-acetylmuramoyl-L-alanyl-D-glutamate--2,6-diaminopimelate ligase